MDERLDERLSTEVPKEMQEVARLLSLCHRPQDDEHARRMRTALETYLVKMSNRRVVVEYVAYATKRAGLGGDAGNASVEIYYQARRALETGSPVLRQRFVGALYAGLERHGDELLEPLLRPR